MWFRTYIFALIGCFFGWTVTPAWANAQQGQHKMVGMDPHDMHTDHTAHGETGGPAAIHTAEEHAKMIRKQKAESSDAKSKPVGVDEQLGRKVPLDITLVDATGVTNRLGDILDRPTLVLPVYYSCPSACMIMLGSLSGSIPEIPLELGEAYHVITISFDDDEDAAVAQQAKRNHTKRLGSNFDSQSWKFLVGDIDQVHRFTESIGYHFKKMGKHAFVHPNALVVLASDGTIIRYLYGPRFSPFDMGMALTEAAAGTPGVSIRKLMTFCFDYQPESKRYVFNSFRIFGSIILVTLIGFVFFLIRKRSAS